MGRRRPRRERDRLARALASQRREGREEGAQAEREELLRQTAARLLADDVEDAVGLLEANGAASLAMIGAAAREAWPTRWRRELGPIIHRIMDSAPIPTNRGPVRLSFDLANPRLADHFDGYMVRLSGQVTDTTAKEITDLIRQGMDEGKSVENLKRDLRGYLGYDPTPADGEKLTKEERLRNARANRRARLIAQNETHSASVSASDIQARESGVVSTQTWLTAGDSRVRPEHSALSNTTVGIDEEFPGGLHPASEIGCRCVILYGVNMDAVRGRAG